jgi:hypothetical protein
MRAEKINALDYQASEQKLAHPKLPVQCIQCLGSANLNMCLSAGVR